MKYLIVNADDFGASRGINRGILEGHRRGILTSTSLMVNAAASEEAAQLSCGAPDLSVGLHFDLTGRADRAALDAQLSRWGRLMPRPPTHLDSHRNIHRDPRLLPSFLDLARAYGLPLREHSPVRPFPKFYGQWGGETHLEQIGVESLKRMLETEIGEGITELVCHPGYDGADLVSSYRAEREVELQTLCDARIRQALAERSIRLIGFHELEKVPPLTRGETVLA
jgi:chitin disaccharide deacetylase